VSTSFSLKLHCDRPSCGAAYSNRSCLLFVGGSVYSVTTITRNFVHRSSPNWVCR